MAIGEKTDHDVGGIENYLKVNFDEYFDHFDADDSELLDKVEAANMIKMIFENITITEPIKS